MKKSHLLGAVCALVINLSVLNANAATFNVISGSFDVIDPSSGSVGIIPLTGNGVLVEGVYDGSASAIATDPLATYAGYDTATFFGNPLDFYYASYGQYDDPGAPLHPAPTIDFGSMTADMTSIFAYWNLHEYNVGGIASVSVLGPNSWELSWSHLQADGPFVGLTTNMTMVVSQVPIPAAVWLFGSGLLGLIGLARRKKA